MVSFAPRLTSVATPALDPDGIKLYEISAHSRRVDVVEYSDELRRLKAEIGVPWANTPAFAILHEGASAKYLTLAWWGNGNELFVRVSVQEGSTWIVDPGKYSFCLWDMEVMWHERQAYIQNIYCENPDLSAYRRAGLSCA
jgi:hypothetical protein